MYQTAEWRHLLEIRQEWMGQGDFGPEHPSRKIQLAIYYMMEESKHLDNVFHHDKELDPQFEKSTDDAFRAAAQALTNYQDPPGP